MRETTTMRQRRIVATGMILLCAGVVVAQTDSNAKPAISMPANRVADSYAIYSSLIPFGETADTGWPHDLWLVKDETITAVADDEPCLPLEKDNKQSFGMNPHITVHPPADRMEDFREILEDFDEHCHEHIQLDPNAWHLSAPVRLLNSKEQAEFMSTRFGHMGQTHDPAIQAKYKGAPALYGFSQVYFNTAHTVALVYATHWCGGLCGQGLWIALALDRNGKWKQLRWAASSWIS